MYIYFNITHKYNNHFEKCWKTHKAFKENWFAVIYSGSYLKNFKGNKAINNVVVVFTGK